MKPLSSTYAPSAGSSLTSSVRVFRVTPQLVTPSLFRGGAGAPGAHGLAESNNTKVQCEHKSVPRASNATSFLRARRPYGALGGPSEGCSRGIDRETSQLTDQFAGCVTIPPPIVISASTILTAAKNPLGWVWDTPGSEVHIIPIFRDGTSDVHLGAGAGPVRPLWVQKELRHGEEIFGRWCGNFDRPLQETQTFEENRSSEPSQINNKRPQATKKIRPP